MMPRVIVPLIGVLSLIGSNCVVAVQAAIANKLAMGNNSVIFMKPTSSIHGRALLDMSREAR